MYSYSPELWIIFFLIYGFAGWVYEEIFYLITEKQLVNRGFIHGPILPIYGAGAIIILFAVMPVSSNPVLVCLVGGFTATVLEYLTGEAMLALFHVRYWDYTGLFLNIKGHICFRATLTWCIASMLLVYAVHFPLAAFLNTIDTRFVYAAAHIGALCFAADFAISFREALDLRAVLDKLTAENEELARLVAEFEKGIDEAEAQLKRAKAEIKAEIKADAERRHAEINERLNRLEELRQSAKTEFERLKFNAEGDIEQLLLIAELKTKKLKTDTENDLEYLKQQVERQYLYIHTRLHRRRNDRSFMRIRAIMRRNRIASRDKYQKALEQLKNNFKEKIKE